MRQIWWPGQLVVRVRSCAQEASGTVSFSNDACFLWPAAVAFLEGPAPSGPNTGTALIQ